MCVCIYSIRSIDRCEKQQDREEKEVSEKCSHSFFEISMLRIAVYVQSYVFQYRNGLRIFFKKKKVSQWHRQEKELPPENSKWISREKQSITSNDYSFKEKDLQINLKQATRYCWYRKASNKKVAALSSSFLFVLLGGSMERITPTTKNGVVGSSCPATLRGDAEKREAIFLASVQRLRKSAVGRKTWCRSY